MTTQAEHGHGPNDGEREYEVGMDEFFKSGSANLYNNMKRTYDEYQEISLTHRRTLESTLQRLQIVAEQNLTNMMTNAQNIQASVQRSVTNALSQDDLITFQAAAHRDIAINRQWNNHWNYQAFRAADEHVTGGHGAGHTPEEQLA